MLHSRKSKWIAAGIAAAVFLSLVLVVSGENIGSEDPLISLSYLTGTYEKSLSEKITQAASAEGQKLSGKLDGYAAGASSQQSVSATHTKVEIPQGSSYVVPAGSEFLMLSGNVLTVAAGLTDTTDGVSVPASGVVSVNHLFVAGQSVTLTAAERTEILIRK